MTELEKSEVMIAKILSLLMEWGIQETRLEFTELELDETDYGSFFFPCVDWLEEEGVIRTGSIHRTTDSACSGIVVRPTLTAFGLKVLGHKMVVGANEEALSDTIKKVSDEGANYSGFGDLLGGILGGFTKSMGS